MTLCLASFSIPSSIYFSLVATFGITVSLTVVILPKVDPRLTISGALVGLFGHELKCQISSKSFVILWMFLWRFSKRLETSLSDKIFYDYRIETALVSKISQSIPPFSKVWLVTRPIWGNLNLILWIFMMYQVVSLYFRPTMDWLIR